MSKSWFTPGPSKAEDLQNFQDLQNFSYVPRPLLPLVFLKSLPVCSTEGRGLADFTTCKVGNHQVLPLCVYLTSLDALMNEDQVYQITSCIDTLLRTFYPPPPVHFMKKDFEILHWAQLYFMWNISLVFSLPAYLHTGTDQILEAKKTWNEVIFNINKTCSIHMTDCSSSQCLPRSGLDFSSTSVVQQLETHNMISSYPFNWNHVQQA